MYNIFFGYLGIIRGVFMIVFWVCPVFEFAIDFVMNILNKIDYLSLLVKSIVVIWLVQAVKLLFTKC